jgi:hypothetical protein
MQNVALVGFFTISGREDRPARPDRYDLSSVQKVGDDRWRFNARMRHGNVDLTLPVTVTMRWVDDTPMIMLTDLAYPDTRYFQRARFLPRRSLCRNLAARRRRRAYVRKHRAHTTQSQ